MSCFVQYITAAEKMVDFRENRRNAQRILTKNAPAAGLWVAYLCYAIGEAIALKEENRRAYLIGLGVYGVAPLLVFLLPPIGVPR